MRRRSQASVKPHFTVIGAIQQERAKLSAAQRVQVQRAACSLALSGFYVTARSDSPSYDMSIVPIKKKILRFFISSIAVP